MSDRFANNCQYEGFGMKYFAKTGMKIAEKPGFLQNTLLTEPLHHRPDSFNGLHMQHFEVEETIFELILYAWFNLLDAVPLIAIPKNCLSSDT
jgi:hypothetical protein